MAKKTHKYILNIHMRKIKIHIYHISSINFQLIEDAKTEYEKLYM